MQGVLYAVRLVFSVELCNEGSPMLSESTLRNFLDAVVDVAPIKAYKGSGNLELGETFGET